MVALFRTAMLGLVVGCLGLGCAAGLDFTDQRLERPSAWPYPRHDLEGTGAVEAVGFSGKLDVIWEEEESGKASGPLALYHNTLVYPSAKRRIRFYDAETGKGLGKLKGKAAIQSGLVIRNGIGCFAVSPRPRVTCVDMQAGDKLWHRSVKEPSAGSIIVDNRLLLGSAAGRLTAYRLDDGSEEWSFAADDVRFTAPPSLGHGTIYQTGDDGALYAVDPTNGSERFQLNLGGPLVSSAVVGDLVYAADIDGNVFAVDPNSEAIVWSAKVGGPVWVPPALANGRLFVGHTAGEVVALNARDGSVEWTFRAVEVIKAAPIVVGPYVIVGTLGGSVYVLRVADGVEVARREVEGAVAIAPVSDGIRVYVATSEGRIYCLGDMNEKQQRADK